MDTQDYDVLAENIDLSKYGAEYYAKSEFSFDKKSALLVETKFSGLNAVDGVLKLQTSISGRDGTFVDIVDNSVTIDVNNGVQYIENVVFTGRFLRVVFVKNSVTSGTIDHIFVMSKNY